MENNAPGGSYTPPPPPPPAGGSPPPQGGGDLIYPAAPAKEPVLILILNLLIVCVGYFIIGQWQKGLVAIAAAFVIGIPTCGMGIGLVTVATAIDGFMQAQHLQQGHPIAQWTFFKDHR